MDDVPQRHLSKLLNRCCGKSFSDIVNGARIRAAKELMRDPSLSISRIGEAVGFSDTAHFSRIFKKETGVTAAEYRNRTA